MKNRTIQICSFFVVAIMSAVISVQAQGITQYRAHIPFDFEIGKMTFASGDYLISLKSGNQSSAVLTVRNAENREAKQLAVMKSGTTTENGKVLLEFERRAGQNALNQLIGPEFGYYAPKSKAQKRLAKKFGQAAETVIIGLTQDN